MRLLTQVVLCLSLLALAFGHGCPPFKIGDIDDRDFFLGNDMVPDAFKNWIRTQPVDAEVVGVYDCHQAVNDNEVGVSAACTSDGECFCTALYNFQECRSCSLACGASTDSLNKDSFQADCSNVKSEISQTCTIDCGYTTYDCFEGDASKPIVDSGARNVFMGTLAGLVAATGGMWLILHAY